MECFRCGANLSDKAMVCNKCGFIVKGARKIENPEPTISFEEKVNSASIEELRAMLLAIKRQRDEAIAAASKKEEVDPEVVAVKKGKRWANLSLIAGILSLVLVVIPGVNVIASLVLFVLAFMGFGKCNGHKINLAMVGLILSIVAIAAAWIYNVYCADTVMQMLGLTPVAEAVTDVANG